jgi:hypothetical protein
MILRGHMIRRHHRNGTVDEEEDSLETGLQNTVNCQLKAVTSDRAVRKCPLEPCKSLGQR